MTDAHRTSPSLRYAVAASCLTLIVGGAFLAWSVRAEHGSAAFYGASLGIAAAWTIGGIWVGGRELMGDPPDRRTWWVAAATAAVVGVSFLIGGYVAAHIPVLDDQVQSLVARTGNHVVPSLILLAGVTGVAEELFFRGGLYVVAEWRRGTVFAVVVTTVIYTATTAVTGNLGLTLAALVLGGMTAIGRAVSGSIIPPIASHVAWTIVAVGVLPLIV